jgi:uncharacterized membrane protein
MVATTPTAAAPAVRAGVRVRSKAKAKAAPAKTKSRRRFRPWLNVWWAVIWAMALFVAAEGGAAVTALLMAGVAAVASASAVRAVGALDVTIPIKGRHVSGPGKGVLGAVAKIPPFLGLAVTASILVPMAAIGGAVPAVVAGFFVAAVTVALVVRTPGRGIPYRALLAALAPSVAAASVVVACSQGLTQLSTLLVAVCLFDAANFMTGNGPSGWPVGSICGAITVGVFAVMVAATMVPPFSGSRPLVLFGLVAVLAPAGVALCGRVSRGKRRLPALRRIDSLVLAGPAWVIGVAVVLHH